MKDECVCRRGFFDGLSILLVGAALGAFSTFMTMLWHRADVRAAEQKDLLEHHQRILDLEEQRGIALARAKSRPRRVSPEEHQAAMEQVAALDRAKSAELLRKKEIEPSLK